MTATLVLCNHSHVDQALSIRYDRTLEISASPPGQNLRLNIDNVTHRMLSRLDPLSRDLLEVAAYVYYADCSIRRGTEADIYARHWRRKFKFVVPVSDPDVWNSPEIKGSLEETLEFVSGDEFSFDFRPPPRPQPTQLIFNFASRTGAFVDCDCVSLFSGGLDSLIGTLFLLRHRRQHPLLVSHRSMSIVSARQKRLTALLRQRNPEWQFPHLSMWVNRKGERAREQTQRTRSFLYLSIAAAVAMQLNLQRVYICENGVVSINIPLSGQNLGTLLTRSTHPKFLRSFESLVNTLFAVKMSVENPFIFSTKTEMLRMLENWSQSELIQETVSCSRAQGKTKMQPQCGTCYQCVNRRFSVLAGDLETHDKAEFYERDVFLDPLAEGIETACAEGYVRTAYEIAEMNDVQFFSKYPQLDEIVSNVRLPPDECGQKVFHLFQRHAKEVMGVVNEKFMTHLPHLLTSKLPEDCLISMLGARHHLLHPVRLYAEKIGGILARALPLDFQKEKPQNERRVQEAAQAALAAADEPLRRECPMLHYAIVQTKPDFADVRDFDRLLFVEIKLVNNRPKLNKVVTEITSRIMIYRDQGAFALFVVYDTARFIDDDEQFVRPLERHDRTRVIAVR